MTGSENIVAGVVTSSEDILNVIGNLGAFGVLAYLVVFVLPKTAKDIMVFQAAERAFDRQSRHEDRDASQQALGELMSMFRDEQKEERSRSQVEQRSEREMCDRQFQQIMGVLKENQVTIVGLFGEMKTLIQTHDQFAKSVTEKLLKT